MPSQEGASQVDIREIGSWIIRQRTPQTPPPHSVIVLLHGYTGDENAMWIFASRLPKSALLIAPRALHQTPFGGYGWHNHQPGEWASIEDFRPAVEALNALLIPQNFPGALMDRIQLVGFSQGAALGFAFGLLYPQRVLSIAGLAGFFPAGAESWLASKPLQGVPVFIAHGTRDELVPVEMARRAIQSLQAAGADVMYCEDDVGHKLSLTCFSSLEAFAAMHSAAADRGAPQA